MTPDQARAARKLLGWTAYRVALACGFSHNVISTFETTGRMRQDQFARTNRVDRLAKLRAVLEAAGVEFVDGDRPGVRLREVAS